MYFWVNYNGLTGKSWKKKFIVTLRFRVCLLIVNVSATANLDLVIDRSNLRFRKANKIWTSLCDVTGKATA